MRSGSKHPPRDAPKRVPHKQQPSKPHAQTGQHFNALDLPDVRIVQGSENASLQALQGQIEKMRREIEQLKRQSPSTPESRPRAVTFGTGETKVTLEGKPFIVAQRNRAEFGKFQRVLPENIYAATILLYMSAAHWDKTEGDWVPGRWDEALSKTLKVCVAPLIVTISMQVTLAWYLYISVIEVDGDLVAECRSDLLWLQVVALCHSTRDGVKVLQHTVREPGRFT